MQLELSDLIRSAPDSVSVVLLLLVAVILIMQASLTIWTLHLTPDEIRMLRLP
jgi:hypothetical protein